LHLAFSAIKEILNSNIIGQIKDDLCVCVCKYKVESSLKIVAALVCDPKVSIKIVLKCQMCREMDYRTPCLYLIMDINFHPEIETELILKRRINEGVAVVAVTILELFLHSI